MQQVSTWASVREFINLDLYPIDQPDSLVYQQLVQKCRHSLKTCGAAELRDFMTPWGLEKLIEDGAAMEAAAYHNALVGNAYLDEPDADLPPDHVRRKMEPTSLGAVAYDQIPKDSLLRKIFEWDPVMHFVGAVLELPTIYRYADPMGALNLAVMKDGDYLRWHFDQTDFVTSLSVRGAESGGNFEYVPMIRGVKEENYQKVRALLDGSREGVVEIANAPGTFLLFMGRYSIHRVTPIRGKTSRLMGLFGFDSKPGVASSDYLRKIRYGRTEAIKPA